MHSARFSTILGFAIALPFLSGCGERRNTSDAILPDVPAGPVSTEDKKAAQALSIGNVGPSVLPKDAYQQAVACRDVATVLTARFQAAGTLDASQRQALAAMLAHYQRLGHQLEPPKPDASAHPSAQPPSEADSDLPSQARLLMACAQRMQGG